ncbi:PCC domain-containing protein [Ktedonobacter robiniae]|uniref:PPC domain-containing DNA-binding protein n=1 Tax=Ktedonobacter robiniae TaxID=2778365 RepID=UPI0019157A06
MCDAKWPGCCSLYRLGGFSDAILGYFEPEKKSYKKISLDEQVEVLALTGDITLKEDGTPQIHAHVVVGDSNGLVHGGHIMEAHVRPTLEFLLEELPAHWHRRHDPESGLAIIAL